METLPDVIPLKSPNYLNYSVIIHGQYIATIASKPCLKHTKHLTVSNSKVQKIEDDVFLTLRTNAEYLDFSRNLLFTPQWVTPTLCIGHYTAYWYVYGGMCRSNGQYFKTF